MQIQLKQVEITAALKAYIQSQGFNLENKQIEIQYTAGRKESGVYADIFINETPPVVEEVAVTTTPSRKTKTITAEQTGDGMPAVVVEVVPVEDLPVEDFPTETSPKTTSLFGG